MVDNIYVGAFKRAYLMVDWALIIFRRMLAMKLGSSYLAHPWAYKDRVYIDRKQVVQTLLLKSY